MKEYPIFKLQPINALNSAFELSLHIQVGYNSQWKNRYVNSHQAWNMHPFLFVSWSLTYGDALWECLFWVLTYIDILLFEKYKASTTKNWSIVKCKTAQINAWDQNGIANLACFRLVNFVWSFLFWWVSLRSVVKDLHFHTTFVYSLVSTILGEFFSACEAGLKLKFLQCFWSIRMEPEKVKKHYWT